jgi:hypothetical protein
MDLHSTSKTLSSSPGYLCGRYFARNPMRLPFLPVPPGTPFDARPGLDSSIGPFVDGVKNPAQCSFRESARQADFQ